VRGPGRAVEHLHGDFRPAAIFATTRQGVLGFLLHPLGLRS